MRRRSATCVAVLVALVAIGVASAAPAQQVPPTPGERPVDPPLGARDTSANAPTPAQVQAVQDKAQATGRVRVLVELKTQFTPEGRLGRTERQAQRARLRQERSALVGSLGGSGATVRREFQSVPLVALELSPAAVDALVRSGRAASVVEDVADPPTLAETTDIIGAGQAWASGATGTGATVAVLDTGVQRTHPFLGGRVTEEACFTDGACSGGADQAFGTGTGAPCNSSRCDHGTHVAGIAAGNGSGLSGVAPSASVMSVQVFTVVNGSPVSYQSDQIAALEHVLGRAQAGLNVAAVNMSLGGSATFENPCDTDPREEIIANLRSFGVPTVISAGNNGASKGLSAPACISSAISVGATDDDDDRASFSNVASYLTLVAPGVNVRSSVPNNAFGSKSGTSMSAPHVAGAWAVLHAAQPTATLTQILNAVIDSGTSVKLTKKVTKRRLDLGAALIRLGTGGATTTSSSTSSTSSSSSSSSSTSSTSTSSTSSTTSTTLAPGTGLVFIPVADAMVKESDARQNFGATTDLGVNASPRKASFLRFNVAGIGSQPVTRVVLRLRATGSSDNGGRIARVADNLWGEQTITWSNQPPADAMALASILAVVEGVDYEADLTGLLTGDGLVSIRIEGTSTDGTGYSSRETGSLAPRLVVTAG